MRQLGADLILDDDTRFVDIENTELAWSENSDTLVTISPTGLVTVVAAYEDTTVNIQATWQGVSDPDGFDIPVLNLGNDDFPGYHGDLLDDAWQFTYFGAPPNANAATPTPSRRLPSLPPPPPTRGVRKRGANGGARSPPQPKQRSAPVEMTWHIRVRSLHHY